MDKFGCIFDGSTHRDLKDGAELRGVDVNCEGIHRLCPRTFSTILGRNHLVFLRTGGRRDV